MDTDTSGAGAHRQPVKEHAHEQIEMTLELIPGAVRRRRMQHAMTQRDLANRSDLDVSTISYLERGVRRARISTIGQLAKALDCEPLDIARIGS